mmetsp:Transcript_67745/g.192004  ORF Transcript_67745/g.192004 Transcript_67745/m.192004 type:complete len:256 (-) Transcript_67745:669-1436(-)
MPSSESAIACSDFPTARSSAFFLSSDASNWAAQYSFFWSSCCCSFFRFATISSTMAMTFSKPPWVKAFLPLSASTRRSSPARSRLSEPCRARRIAARASERMAEALVLTCTKLALGLGRVFLNNSRASSSLRSLMVSASARSSSARVFDRSSHSAFFVSQPFFSSARNFLSSARASSVSDRSSFIWAIFTPSSPIRVSFSWMDAVKAATSLVLAAIRPSKLAMAAFSAVVASVSPWDISSPICLRMPVTSPLCGE